MAATPFSRTCPIRVVSVHLLDAAGRLLRVLFLDREGHISAQPHFVHREEALILAANQLRLRGVLVPGKHYRRWGCTQGRWPLQWHLENVEATITGWSRKHLRL